MPGILIDCLRKYQRLSQTPLESTRAPVHFLMLGGAGQAVPTIDAYWAYAKQAQYPRNENVNIHSTSTDGVSVDPITTKNRRIVSNQK